MAALRNGEVAVLSLAGGVGSRWTRGAGVVKALNPFAKLAGEHRNFIEVHLAKSRRRSQDAGAVIPHLFSTSYLTHRAIADWLSARGNYGYEGPLVLSPGRSIGLRLTPMVRDLRFAWEETPQQILDEQAQKVQESLHNALIGWAQVAGEGTDYTDNLPAQCIHPVGHWYELPNLLRNGVLARLLAERPQLRVLMMHNIDTVGADVDPALLGHHLSTGAAMTVEVIHRQLADRGGGLARVDGRPRLVEGLALPHEEIEFRLRYYNSNTFWIDIDRILAVFGLSRADLANQAKVDDAVRVMAARMPTYVTLKDVKKRWGKGQEDIFPVTQFEKLWGDMTALPEVESRFVAVPVYAGSNSKSLRNWTAGYGMDRRGMWRGCAGGSELQ
ncbi:MAG: UTP--glucose-1-phosphate uridylyltransferase [Caldilineaceae bacterium]